MDCVTQSQASVLLRNKFVLIIGDSIQRSVYKDLVLLLEKGEYLTITQLKLKGEMSFENDCLLEGGLLSQAHSNEYREVRQYCGNHHLIRFYYTTFIYSPYMESILASIENGVKPDIIILNSCVWDLSRFNRAWVPKYEENLHKLLTSLKKVIPSECVVMWHMSMPVSGNVVGGYFLPQLARQFSLLRHEAIEANFYSGMAATSYGLNVVDVHFHVRQNVPLAEDGPSEIAMAHRRITCLLLECAARAWGVEHCQPHSWFISSKQTQPAQQTQPPQQTHPTPEPAVNAVQPIDYSRRVVPQHQYVPQHMTPMPLNLSQAAAMNPYQSGAAAHSSWQHPVPLYPQPLYQTPGMYLPMNVPYYARPYVQRAYSGFRMTSITHPSTAAPPGGSMEAGSSSQQGQQSTGAENEKGSKKKPSTNVQAPPDDE